MRKLVSLVAAGVLLTSAVMAAEPAATAPGVGASATTATAPAAAPSLVPGSRVLKTFDFEEEKEGNYETVPMFWAKVTGHGFPAYSAGRFDNRVFRSAKHSFKLEIDGGSAAFQYSPGKLVINPSADYYVLAFVKTTALAHAKAQMSAWFADGEGKILPATGLHSQAYAMAKGGGVVDEAVDAEWHVLHLFIPGPGAGSAAKSLVLQLGLLQPQQLAGPAAVSNLGKFALYQQDIKGAAWFDDVVVFQLPRLSVKVPEGVTANIFGASQKVELDLTVSDLQSGDAKSTGDLTASLKITGPDGLLYAAEKFAVEQGGASGNEAWTHHYVREGLPPALYTATLDVMDKGSGTLVARRQTRFLCLAPAINGLERAAPEFGLSLPGGTEVWGDLPAILKQTRAGLVQIPAWRKEMTEDALLRRDPPFDSLMAMLQRNEIHALASFADVPAALAARISQARVKSPLTDANPPAADSILALYDADPGLWRPYVSFLLARYGNRMDGWEFGTEETPYSGGIGEGAVLSGGNGRYAKLYAKTGGELGQLLNHPKLVIPWNGLVEFEGKDFPEARLDLRLPTAIRPSQIPAYLENFSLAQAGVSAATTGPATMPGAANGLGSAGEARVGAPTRGTRPAAGIFAHLDSLDEEHYDRMERLSDFAERVVYARSASPAAVLVDLPMSSVAAGGRFNARTEPDEILLVYRTLIQTLGNSRYLREIPLGSGLKGFLFDRSGVGTLVVWNESGAAAAVHLDLPLGGNPRVIDLMGNVKALAVDEKGTSGVNVTSVPMILDQLDSKTLQLRASFGLGTTHFPAGAGAVRTEIFLTNPYSDTLTGNLKVMLPKGWSMEPSTIGVALAAGGTLKKTVMIKYPYSELSGRQAIEGRLVTDSGARFDFSCAVGVTSDVVEVDASSQLLANGDLVIQQVITNIGHAVINAQAYSLVPGYPRQQRYLLDLEPGQTTIKRFVFPLSTWVNFTKETTAGDVAGALAGKAATVGLRGNEGRVLITKSLPLE